MKRLAAARIVARLLTPTDVVVCGLGSTGFAWSEQRSANLTYWASDPMGIWPSFALGLALAQPARRIIFLEGDGDLSMNLQVLLTMGEASPPNLKVVIFHNGAYASAGGNPLAGAAQMNLAAICRGCGFDAVTEAIDERQALAAASSMLSAHGLALVVLHLEEEPPADSPQGGWSQSEDRAFFMKELLGNGPPA